MPATGSVFAGYRLEDRVAGHTGRAVYRARDARLGRLVALKVISPPHAGDSLTRERLNRELTLAASLDHPNVVPLYEAGESDGSIFIATRWVEGFDLAEIVHREHPLPVTRAVALVGQVAAALEIAHQHGLLHRDVKPEHVLVAPDDHVYLTGFGLARHQSDPAGLTATSEMVGTLDHVAPEQIQGADLDARVDVYALGCLLFQTLTGEVPYSAQEPVAKLMAHLSPNTPSVLALRSDVPPALSDVIRSAMDRDREQRPASAADFRSAISDSLAPAPSSRVPERAPGQVLEDPASLMAAQSADPQEGGLAGPLLSHSPGAAQESVVPELEPGGDGGGVFPPAPQRGGARDGLALEPLSPGDGDAKYVVYGRHGRLRAPRQKRGLRRRGVRALATLAIAALIAAPVALYAALRDSRAGTQTVLGAQAASAVAAVGTNIWLASPGQSALVGVLDAAPAAAHRRIGLPIRADLLAGGGGLLVAAAGHVLVTLSPDAAGPTRQVSLPGSAVAIATRDGHTTWVALRGQATLLRVSDGVKVSVPLPGAPGAVAIGRRLVWVTLPRLGEVLALDAATGHRYGPIVRVGGTPTALAVDTHSVWVADATRGLVVRVNSSTGRSSGPPTPVSGQPIALAADDRDVWVVRQGADAATRLDAQTGRPLDEVGVARSPVAVALTPVAVWIAGARGTLTRIARN